MKQNIIFMFILLVTLSIVNAIPFKLHEREETKFLKCPKGDPLTVEMSPDPAKPGEDGTYKISGELSNEIPKGSILFIGFINPSTEPPELVGDPLTVNFCDQDVECPVDGGTSFETKVDYETPDNLPNSYVIVVAVVSPKQELLGCAYAAVGDIKNHDNDYSNLALS